MNPVPTFVPCHRARILVWGFTLATSEYSTRAPSQGTECERCLRGCPHLVLGNQCQELTKIVCTQGAGAHCCAQVQGRDLVLGHRYRTRILAWVL